MTPRTLPQTEQLPRALYTAEQVRGFDRLAIGQFGVPGLTLMERAGTAAFECYEELDGLVENYARNRALLLEELPKAGFERLAP